MAKDLKSQEYKDVSLNSDDVSQFSHFARKLLSDSLQATATLSNYAYSYRMFEEWLLATGVNNAPTHIDLCNFLAAQYEGHFTERHPETKRLLPTKGGQISVATLENRRWAIIEALKVKRVFFSKEDAYEIERFMKALRMGGEQERPKSRRGQAAPLRPENVDAICRSLTLAKMPHFKRIRDLAIIAIARTTGSRESEMFGQYGLRIKDVEIQKKSLKVTRMVLKGGNRTRNAVNFILPTKTAYCPVKAIKDYLSFISNLPGMTDTNAFFIRCSTNGLPIKQSKDSGLYPGLGPKKFDQMIRCWAHKAQIDDLDIQQLSGHSFRVGLDVYLLEKGVDPVKISEITKQEVSTVLKYGRSRTPIGFSGHI